MPEARTPERICLFGGTFDPIHLGHLRIANEALKAASLTKILFVPAANPPHKKSQPVTPFEDRFRMVQIACVPYPCFVASSLEANGDHHSFTIDTLERVSADVVPGDEILFLIGADAFAEITSWKRWQDVIARVQFIVVSRPGIQYETPANARVLRLDGIDIPISSSEIRSRLALGETTPEVPVEVREYIVQRSLYGLDQDSLGAGDSATALP